jgi:hypothetical protein
LEKIGLSASFYNPPIYCDTLRVKRAMLNSQFKIGLQRDDTTVAQF